LAVALVDSIMPTLEWTVVPVVVEVESKEQLGKVRLVVMALRAKVLLVVKVETQLTEPCQ
jgi:hypothetical protein